MNMKKTWKRFWTMNRNHAGGFTLVELIVVIAILAVLAGIGVPAYSGYIEKTNKVSDQALVAEVANALMLHYFVNNEGATASYVKLTSGGATAEGMAIDAMMNAFGETWGDDLKLKYDEWSGSMMTIVSGYEPEVLDRIANSSYMTTSTPASLMNAVVGITGLANTVISERVDSLDEARTNLVRLFGADSNIVTTLDNMSMNNASSAEYSTVISNMLVNEMSTVFGENENLTNMMNMYAAAYAYGEANNDFAAFDAMTAQLSSNALNMNILLGIDAETGETDSDAGLNFLVGSMMDENGDYQDDYLAFIYYMDPEANPEYDGTDSGAVDRFVNDSQALADMMGAVQEISGGFMDRDSLMDQNLFTSDAVMNQVNSYYNSIQALAGMDEATRELLGNGTNGDVVVMVTAQGAVAVIPGNAYPAGR